MAPLCQICRNALVACLNFGGKSCKSCAAFFRRTIRLQATYTCHNNPISCAENSICKVTSMNICKKCRLDRCYSVGMRPAHVKEARSQSYKTLKPIGPAAKNPNLPLLNAMVAVVKATFTLAPISNNASCYVGTSEAGTRYYPYSQYRLFMLTEARRFRNVIERTPIVCDLSTATKDVIFKNSMQFYKIFVQNYNHIRHISRGMDPKRYYIDSNTYFDRHIDKVHNFLSTMQPQSASLIPWRSSDCHILAKQLTSNIQKQTLDFAMQNAIFTEEDVAAVLILILIHTNKSISKCQQPMNRLKEVWKELDIYYRTTHRDPHSWANLFFLVSNIHTCVEDLRKATDILNVYFGSTMFQSIEDAENPAQFIEELIEAKY